MYAEVCHHVSLNPNSYLSGCTFFLYGRLMRFFGIIAALLLVAVVGINGGRHHPMSEEMKKYKEECRTELGVTEEEEHEMHRHHDEDNEKMKCMSACLMKKQGFLDEDNNLNVEKMVESAVQMYEAEPVKAKEIIEECAEKAEDVEEECAFAKRVHKCTRRKMWREFRRNHPLMTEEMKKNMKECKEELGITEEEDREKHKNHDMDNEKMRCMPSCMMKKEAVLGANRKFNLEKFLESELARHPDQNKETMEELFEKCVKEAENEKDECDVGRTFIHCKHMNRPRHRKEPKEN